MNYIYPVTVRVTLADGQTKDYGFETVRSTENFTSVRLPLRYPEATFEIIENKVPANYSPTIYL